MKKAPAKLKTSIKNAPESILSAETPVLISSNSDEIIDDETGVKIGIETKVFEFKDGHTEIKMTHFCELVDSRLMIPHHLLRRILQ